MKANQRIYQVKAELHPCSKPRAFIIEAESLTEVEAVLANAMENKRCPVIVEAKLLAGAGRDQTKFVPYLKSNARDHEENP